MLHVMVAAQSSSAALLERVGHHEVLVPIAHGGMATVYLARSLGPHGFERFVAVKLLHAHLLQSDTENWAASFVAEAKIAARIRHPNVVPVIDFGETPQGMFLVMDYIEGDS